MRTSLIAVALLGVVSGAWADEFFPIEGRSWVYRVDGSERVVTVGGAAELTLALETAPGEVVRGWKVEGLGQGETWLVPRDGGVRIVSKRAIGVVGAPSNVIVAELRWEDEAWSFDTADGCMLEHVDCRRVGIETLGVPAGSFECLRIEVGEGQTFWVARGVGIVRMEDGTRGAEIVWELEREGAQRSD